VTSETNINIFWTDLVTAVKAGEIPIDCFKVERELTDHPPRANSKNAAGAYVQGRWNSYKLFMDPDPMISALQIFLTKAREKATPQTQLVFSTDPIPYYPHKPAHFPFLLPAPGRPR